MDERDFAKYAFLIIAVVAVVGLLTTGSVDVTGFAARGVVAGAGTQDHNCRPAGDNRGRCNAGLFCDGQGALARCRQIRCSDTDSGQNFNVPGTVTGLRTANAATATSASDSCRPYSAILTEFYCAPNRVYSFVTHNCARDGKTCQNGACALCEGQPCLGLNAACRYHTQCASGLCGWNTGGPQNIYVCEEPNPVGSICYFNQECASGRCVRERCA